MTDPSHDNGNHAPSPSLWPVGFAVGVAVALVGIVVSWPLAVVGGLVAVVFGWLWVRDLFREHGAPEAIEPGLEEAPPPGAEPHVPTYDRGAFLSASTIGIGGLIGALVVLPSLGFAVLPAFDDDEWPEVDLGPIENFPEGEFVVTRFTSEADLGQVSERTAYIRYNGRAENGEPSFTTLYSRCVHLGCPVQANGPVFDDRAVEYEDVLLVPTLASGFGCPCHGGQYDNEGNRTAGPPVRSLDRFEFSIVNGNLVLGKPYSVGTVEGVGAKARIGAYERAYPGVHVDGISAWLYPLPVPGIEGGY